MSSSLLQIKVGKAFLLPILSLLYQFWFAKVRLNMEKKSLRFLLVTILMFNLTCARTEGRRCASWEANAVWWCQKVAHLTCIFWSANDLILASIKSWSNLHLILWRAIIRLRFQLHTISFEMELQSVGSRV